MLLSWESSQALNLPLIWWLFSAHELVVGASSSRFVDVERSTTEGADIDAGTTEGADIDAGTTDGYPTTEGAGSEKPDPLTWHLALRASGMIYLLPSLYFFMHWWQLHVFLLVVGDWKVSARVKYE